MKGLHYYLSLPYTVEVRHDEDGYFARVLELPGCMTDADVPEELWPRLEEAMTDWIEVALEFGDDIPEPAPESRTSHVLRMPWIYPSPKGMSQLLRSAT
jgi:predicted RNase H-like HicB family nuclease